MEALVTRRIADALAAVVQYVWACKLADRVSDPVFVSRCVEVTIAV